MATKGNKITATDKAMEVVALNPRAGRKNAGVTPVCFLQQSTSNFSNAKQSSPAHQLLKWSPGTTWKTTPTFLSEKSMRPARPDRVQIQVERELQRQRKRSW